MKWLSELLSKRDKGRKSQGNSGWNFQAKQEGSMEAGRTDFSWSASRFLIKEHFWDFSVLIHSDLGDIPLGEGSIFAFCPFWQHFKVSKVDHMLFGCLEYCIRLCDNRYYIDISIFFKYRIELRYLKISRKISVFEKTGHFTSKWAPFAAKIA